MSLRVRSVPDVAVYIARVEPWLLRNEAEHNLLPGLLPALLAGDHAYAPPICLAWIEDVGGVAGCAFRRKVDELMRGNALFLWEDDDTPRATVALSAWTAMACASVAPTRRPRLSPPRSAVPGLSIPGPAGEARWPGVVVARWCMALQHAGREVTHRLVLVGCRQMLERPHPVCAGGVAFDGAHGGEADSEVGISEALLDRRPGVGIDLEDPFQGGGADDRIPVVREHVEQLARGRVLRARIGRAHRPFGNVGPGRRRSDGAALYDGFAVVGPRRARWHRRRLGENDDFRQRLTRAGTAKAQAEAAPLAAEESEERLVDGCAGELDSARSASG